MIRFTEWKRGNIVELLRVDTIEETINKLGRYADQLPLYVEEVEYFDALGCILAEDVISQENVPGFRRSTMDGYAVRSSDTGGASESMPTFFKVKGEVEMGKAPSGEASYVGAGECVYVPTGGMIPEGADAVVMVEYCEMFGMDEVAVYTSVSGGNNIVMQADDVKVNQILLSRGRRLKPADMGLMSAIGHTKVKVYSPWKISIFSTGDEIISPYKMPEPGQVRDVNTFALLGQAKEMGFNVIHYEVVMDDEKVLKEKAAAAMQDSDLIFISGGSSQGKKDATAKIIEKLTSSGVLTHGVAVKPGKPTITGFDEPTGTALVGLPGHPVAAVLLFRILAGALWDQALGILDEEKIKYGITSLTDRGIVAGRLHNNIAASPGRKTFQLIKFIKNLWCLTPDVPEVIPVLGKSGLIRTMSEADGYMVMDVNDEGMNAGELVKVILL